VNVLFYRFCKVFIFSIFLLPVSIALVGCELGHIRATESSSDTAAMIYESWINYDAGRYAVSVEAGSRSAFIILSDGSLWGWGINEHGQLGDGTRENRYTPVWIMNDVKAVSKRCTHTMAITTDGGLWAWGGNGFYWSDELGGRQIEPGRAWDDSAECYLIPRRIMDNVKEVTVCDTSALIVTMDGTLWQWHRRTPLPIELMSEVVAASITRGTLYVIKTDGSLWGKGGNAWGGVGDGSRVRQDEFVWIMDDVVVVVTGTNHAMAIMSDSSLWAWGSNRYGQVADGTQESRDSPVWIMDDVITVSTSRWNHAVAIRTDGTMWGWGTNDGGQLRYIPGRLSPVNRIERQPVHLMEDIQNISAGEGFTLLVKADGSVHGMGLEFWTWTERNDLEVELF